MTTKTPRRFYCVAYSSHSASDHGNRAFIHQVRDGMANSEIGAALAKQGYEFGTTLHLLPHMECPLDSLPFVQNGELRKNDLLVLTTRPPMNDEEDTKNRRPILKHTGEIETLYMGALQKYFSFCNRRDIELTPHVLRLLPEAMRNTPRYNFRQNLEDNVNGYYVPEEKDGKPGSKLRLIPGGTNYTFVFFIRLPSIPRPGCSLILSFGMSGLSTLAWNRILRMRHPEWIATRSFIMAKLTCRLGDRRDSLMTPEFADDEKVVRVDVLAEEKL